ncbi:hypothetical protein BH20VER1_BH20VER1_00190 [soil metagenome]
MKHISLHALLCLALLLAVAGCGTPTSPPAEWTQFRAPQTGSNIRQRVVARTTPQQVQTRKTSPKKRGTEVADPDFVPRGGFR